MPCFADYHGKLYHFLMEMEEKYIKGEKGGGGREQEKRRKGKQWLVCKINKQNLKKRGKQNCIFKKEKSIDQFPMYT